MSESEEKVVRSVQVKLLQSAIRLSSMVSSPPVKKDFYSRVNQRADSQKHKVDVIDTQVILSAAFAELREMDPDERTPIILALLSE